MKVTRMLTVALRFVVVILGLGVLSWVWTQSASPERLPPNAGTSVAQLQARDASGRRKSAVWELSPTPVPRKSTQ